MDRQPLNQTPLYLCVYLAGFPAQARLRLRTELHQQPVAVLEGDAPLQRVCSTNRAAERMGIAAGMTRAELDVFEGVHTLPRSAEEERAGKAALVDLAGAFTPRVEVQPSTGGASFAMVLDMTGTSRIFGQAAQAARGVAAAVLALGFFPRVACSTNLQTAVCLAAFAHKECICIAPGQEAQAHARLPVAAIAPSEAQALTFQLWGVRTLGELAALPEVELIVRLGQEGKRLRLLARGEHPHLMVPEEPPFTLGEFLAFEAPVEILDSLLFALGPMLDAVLVRAQAHAFALASVTVTLGIDGGGTHRRTVKPALPLADRDILLKLLHLDLQANPPEAGVLSLHLQAEPGPRGKVQMGLFSPQLPEPMRLDVTLARIAAMVGEGRVGRAVLSDSHRAEAFTMERFTVPATGSTRGSSGNAPGANSESAQDEDAGHWTTVALRRLRPPLPVYVQKGERGLHSFTVQGQRYMVQQAYGPWRKSGEWWTADLWSREEWDVRATAASGQGELLGVISHDRLRLEWQLEALYD